MRKWFERRSNIRLKMIIWVNGVLRRTVVGDWRFDTLCGSHLQSSLMASHILSKRVHIVETLRGNQLSLKMASAHIVEMSVVNNDSSQDSSHPDDHFQSKYVIPGFKPVSYLRSHWRQSETLANDSFSYARNVRRMKLWFNHRCKNLGLVSSGVWN